MSNDFTIFQQDLQFHLEVLEAAAEMMDYKGSGMSVMEMNPRSKWFDDIIKDAEKVSASLPRLSTRRSGQ